VSNKRKRASGSRPPGSNQAGSRSSSGGGKRTTSSGGRRTAAGGSVRRVDPNQRRPAASSRRERPAPRPRLAAPDDAPSAGYSLARGLLTTLSSPALVVLTFLAALLIWGALAAIGWPPQPIVMNEALSLAPIHTTIDLFFLLAVGPTLGGIAPALIGFVSLVLIHTLFVTLAVSLSRSAQDHVPTRRAVDDALALLRSRFLRVLIVELGYISVSILIIFLVQILGTIAFVIGLMVTLYFSVFVPPAVILDGMAPRDGLRASLALARMTGTLHGLLVGGYVLFVLLMFFSPGRAGVATPTIQVWAFALLAGLVHVVFLSAFVHRWRVLSPALSPEPATKGRREPAAAE
jgi:hypothetical protein